MTDKEKAALLEQLIQKHFYLDSRGALTWGYREDCGLRDIDPDLETKILEACPLS